MNAELILGIETSCDETAAAVVARDGAILSNVVASQIALHAPFGGVVPELASREHLRNLVPVVRAALEQAGIAYPQLSAIAVTEGPGLAGALLVGVLYAKALAFGLEKPLIAVNHLEGHIHAVLMQQREQDERPLLALVVSGGHTHLYLAQQTPDLAQPPADLAHPAPGGIWNYRNVGSTVDDAAGEAYDKVAKLLGLGYPGGPWMDALAPFGNPDAVPFHFAQIKPRRAVDESSEKAAPRFDFSFSGIKTAVLRYVQAHAMAAEIERSRAVIAATPGLKPEEAAALLGQRSLDLIASFQAAVVGNLMRQTFAAAEHYGASRVVVSGGVAANRELRRRFAQQAGTRGVQVAFPALALATDNAAMIAAAAWPKFFAGDFAPETLAAQPQLRLG